jgi:hypothetical protein
MPGHIQQPAWAGEHAEVLGVRGARCQPHRRSAVVAQRHRVAGNGARAERGGDRNGRGEHVQRGPAARRRWRRCAEPADLKAADEVQRDRELDPHAPVGNRDEQRPVVGRATRGERRAPVAVRQRDPAALAGPQVRRAGAGEVEAVAQGDPRQRRRATGHPYPGHRRRPAGQRARPVAAVGQPDLLVHGPSGRPAPACPAGQLPCPAGRVGGGRPGLRRRHVGRGGPVHPRHGGSLVSRPARGHAAHRKQRRPGQRDQRSRSASHTTNDAEAVPAVAASQSNPRAWTHAARG